LQTALFTTNCPPPCKLPFLLQTALFTANCPFYYKLPFALQTACFTANCPFDCKLPSALQLLSLPTAFPTYNCFPYLLLSKLHTALLTSNYTLTLLFICFLFCLLLLVSLLSYYNCNSLPFPFTTTYPFLAITLLSVLSTLLHTAYETTCLLISMSLSCYCALYCYNNPLWQLCNPDLFAHL
jgi:hypothetical protein